MKRVLAILFVFCVLVGLVGCSRPNLADNSIEAWNEKDFSFYDTDDNEKVFLTVGENNAELASTPKLYTYRGVQIGDRAITALRKYDIPIGYAVYGTKDIMLYDKNVNIDQEIRNCAKSGEKLSVVIFLDEKFEYLEAYKHMVGDEQLPNFSWVFGFEIEDEKIENVMIMKIASVSEFSAFDDINKFGTHLTIKVSEDKKANIRMQFSGTDVKQNMFESICILKTINNPAWDYCREVSIAYYDASEKYIGMAIPSKSDIGFKLDVIGIIWMDEAYKDEYAALMKSGSNGITDEGKNIAAEWMAREWTNIDPSVQK